MQQVWACWAVAGPARAAARPAAICSWRLFRAAAGQRTPMAWAGGHCRSVATLCAACDGWAVRSGSAASGRMRLAMGLTIVGAVRLITGLVMVFVSEVLLLMSDHIAPGLCP